MERRVEGLAVVARVYQKSKSPIRIKSTVVLLSDGSTWERQTRRDLSGKKIKSSWAMLNRRRVINPYSRKIFLDIFCAGGWKKA